MSKHLLIKFWADYADEFDVSGFIVLSEDEWEQHKAKVAAHFEKKKVALPIPRELPADYKDPNYFIISDERRKYQHSMITDVYFGTNESIEYDSYEEYLQAFSVAEITDAQYQVLFDLFNVHTNGYSYPLPGKTGTVTVPAKDTIINGTVVMIDPDESRIEDEDELDEQSNEYPEGDDGVLISAAAADFVGEEDESDSEDA